MTDRKRKVLITISIIVLIIALIPWVTALGTGVYYAFSGLEKGALFARSNVYGFEAFGDVFIFCVFFYSPVYLISVLMLIFSIGYLVSSRKIMNDDTQNHNEGYSTTD